jgi:hypothetical protein
MANNPSKVIVQLYREHISSEQILSILQSKKSIKRWAYILHDKDPGKPHFHVMIDFGRSYELSRLYGWFDHPGLETSSLVQPVKSWSAFVQYLIHKNDQDKFQYLMTDIIANYDYNEDMTTSAKVITPAWFGDFEQMDYDKQLIYVNNITNIYEANKKFDQLQKRFKLWTLASEDKREKMRVIFIGGPPRIGKTTFAKWYAKVALQKSYFVAGSSNDPLEGYTSQQVLILDDLRPSNFAFTDLLKLIDPHTGSLIKSRYYNKRFSGTHILITSSVPLSEWYKGVDSAVSAESLYQLYGRFYSYVLLEPGQGSYYYKIDKKTGQPVEDVAFETVPFDLKNIVIDIDDTFEDDKERADLLAQVKALNDKGVNNG